MFTSEPVIPLLGVYQREVECIFSHTRNVYENLFITAKYWTWSQTSNRKIEKPTVVHLYNVLLLGSEKERLRTRATTCVTLTVMALSERNQTQQNTHRVFPFKRRLGRVKPIKLGSKSESRPSGKEWNWLERAMTEFSQLTGTFCFLFWVVVKGVNAIVKTQWTKPLRFGHVSVCTSCNNF